MKCLMQGMRRSGTTVVFEILSRNPRLTAWYEPLGLGRPGGLRGTNPVDPSSPLHRWLRELRLAREAFARDYRRVRVVPDDLNYGAPLRPGREVETALPRHVRDYLKFLFDRDGHTLGKFTRIYCKVEETHRLFPDARFLLLVRHPIRVVASYLHGAARPDVPKPADRETFFSRRSRANPWNSRKLLERIAPLVGRPDWLARPDWQKCLCLWKFTTERAFEAARATYGSAFRLVRHEDLCRDPEREVRGIYDHLGLDPCPEAIAWARANTRPHPRPAYEDDPRWTEALSELRVFETMESIGYDARPA